MSKLTCCSFTWLNRSWSCISASVLFTATLLCTNNCQKVITHDQYHAVHLFFCVQSCYVMFITWDQEATFGSAITRLQATGFSVLFYVSYAIEMSFLFFSLLIWICFDYHMWLPVCKTMSYQILISNFCSNSAVVVVFACISYQLQLTAVKYQHWNVSCWMSWMTSVICSALFVLMSGSRCQVHLQLIYSVYCYRGV